MRLAMARRLRRAQRGSILIEYAFAIGILAIVFLGLARVGFSLHDIDRDRRALRAGVDLVHVIEIETASPTAAQIDRIGQEMALVGDMDSNFAIFFTVFEFDHLGAGLRVAWEGSYGPNVADYLPGARLTGGVVHFENEVFQVEDDERLIVVEVFRTDRGLSNAPTGAHYRSALKFVHDPIHA